VKSYGKYFIRLKFNVKKLDKSFNLIINAHESTIAAIALNQEGNLLATASEKVQKNK